MNAEKNTDTETDREHDISSSQNSIMEDYRSCDLCPRRCHVDRTAGQTGVCGMTDRVRVARAALHFWEETCISGTEGSGAVFFSGCNLRCVFCQNREISAEGYGQEVTVPRLAELFLGLQEQRANNINLVTPTHFLPSIRESLKLARKQGLHIPVVYNCGGYENAEILRELEGLVDIYLPDFKYVTGELAAKYSGAGDYPETACAALAEMYRQTGEAQFDKRGIMQKGVIVRHMVLPGHRKEAEAVLRQLFDSYGNRIYYSIMNQYTPLNYVKEHYPELNRKLTRREYDLVTVYAVELGIENGFIQEGQTMSESFIPAFDGTGVF